MKHTPRYVEYRRLILFGFYESFQFFDSNAMPARTCVGVAYLPFSAAMEIECVAEIPN